MMHWLKMCDIVDTHLTHIYFVIKKLNVKLFFSEKYFKKMQKHLLTDFQCFLTECVLQLSTKQLYQPMNHCILVINIFTCMLYF